MLVRNPFLAHKVNHRFVFSLVFLVFFVVSAFVEVAPDLNSFYILPLIRFNQTKFQRFPQTARL